MKPPLKYVALAIGLTTLLSSCGEPDQATGSLPPTPPPPTVVVNQIIHADFSQDQNLLAYFLSEKEKESLYVYDLETKETKSVFSNQISSKDRLFPGFWWRDSKTLMMKKTLEGNQEQLFVVNRLTNKTSELYKSNDFITHMTKTERDFYFVDQAQKENIQHIDLSSGAIKNFATIPLDFYDSFSFEIFNLEKQNYFLFGMFKTNKKGQMPASGFNILKTPIPPHVDYYMMKPDKNTKLIESMKDMKDEFFFSGGSVSFEGKKIGYGNTDGLQIIDIEKNEKVVEISGKARRAKWLSQERLMVQTDDKVLIYALKDSKTDVIKEISLNQLENLSEYFFLSANQQILLITPDKIYLNELDGDNQLQLVFEKKEAKSGMKVVLSNKTALLILNPAHIFDPDFKGSSPTPLIYQWNIENKIFEEVTKGSGS